MDKDRPHHRLLIIGNGGSGKTWLAQRLAASLRSPVVHLDDLHWQPGRYGVARDKVVRDRLVTEASSGESWIMEGVYGQLAAMVLDRVTTLVWLDLPEDECVANVRDRGIQGGGEEADFENLLKWVADYRLRKNNLNSFGYHQKLFNSYLGSKARLMSRDEIKAFALRFAERGLQADCSDACLTAASGTF